MPTYEYACKDCGEHLEVVQSFSDDSLTVCPACDGRLRKVFSPAGIIFKGSGWHIKDYADASNKAPSASKDSDGPSDDAGSDDKSTGETASSESGTSDTSDSGSASSESSGGSETSATASSA